VLNHSASGGRVIDTLIIIVDRCIHLRGRQGDGLIRTPQAESNLHFEVKNA
jgi:hypothetical protein